MEEETENRLQWEILESKNFLSDPIFSKRHRVPIDSVVFRLRKSIKRGNVIQGCFWAAEMDISGWSDLLWDELFDVSFSDIGLVSPSCPSHLMEYYEMWKKHTERNKHIDCEKFKNDEIMARRIIMTVVRYLCGTWKNRTISHASLWSVAKAQTGVLTLEEWNVSLGMGNYVQEKLSLIKNGHTPSMCKRIENLLVALVGNNEIAGIRHGDYMVISGNTKVFWKIVVLCVEYVHKSIAKDYYKWFIPYLKSYRKACLRYQKECPLDQYLKGGHLEIVGDMYPENEGIFQFEDGSRSYPYSEHPHSQKYEKYSQYIPYGNQYARTNARRMNFQRKCVIQTVTLMCRGQPNGIDERTPLDYTCEDFFANEMYSLAYPVPQEAPEDNFKRVPTDWTTRESSMYSSCDARHWWAVADNLSQVMEIPNGYSDAAFDALLLQEAYYGRRSSEEFILYRYINSLAHYEGIVQEKPEIFAKPFYNSEDILPNGDDHLVIDIDEETKNERMEDESQHEEIERNLLVPSEEVTKTRLEHRMKSVRMLQSQGEISDMIEELRGIKKCSLSSVFHDTLLDLLVPKKLLIQVYELEHLSVFDRTIYQIIKGTSLIRNILMEVSKNCQFSVVSTVNRKIGNAICFRTKALKKGIDEEIAYNIICTKNSKGKSKMMPVTRFIATIHLSKKNGIREHKSFYSILDAIRKSGMNGVSQIDIDSLEKSILLETFASVIIGNGDNLFPYSMEDYIKKFPGFHCPEAFGLITCSENLYQCFWNYVSKFKLKYFVEADPTRMNGAKCKCSKGHLDAWIELLRDIYVKHSTYLIEIIILWNKVIREDINDDLKKIYSFPVVKNSILPDMEHQKELEEIEKNQEEKICRMAHSAPSREIIFRVKKTYTSIMGNRVSPTSVSDKNPNVLDIIFCS